MENRVKPEATFTSRDAQLDTAVEIAQADADYGQIRARLGAHFTEQEFMEAALRLCFPEATEIRVARRRRER